MSESPNVRWGVQQRFEFIEWRIYWSGRVNRKDLEDEFQISTPQASVDLRTYQEMAPGNIEYDATEKSYVECDGFRPKFLGLSPERYLLQLQALTSNAIRKSDTWFEDVPPNDVVPTIVRGPEAYTLRAIVKAIEAKMSIEINYMSLTRTAVRTICPHALGHDGYRWHVRGLDVEKMEFRDYVFGRILSVGKLAPCEVDPAEDISWHSRITLKLIAHPDLDDRQKKTVEHDYRFVNGELSVEMRLALAFYFIKRHNLDLRDSSMKPERAQLYLQNYDEVIEASKQAELEARAKTTARLSSQTHVG